jgi:hypothetical protein
MAAVVVVMEVSQAVVAEVVEVATKAEGHRHLIESVPLRYPLSPATHPCLVPLLVSKG